jgi:hypothetical protein
LIFIFSWWCNEYIYKSGFPPLQFIAIGDIPENKLAMLKNMTVFVFKISLF